MAEDTEEGAVGVGGGGAGAEPACLPGSKCRWRNLGGGTGYSYHLKALGMTEKVTKRVIVT